MSNKQRWRSWLFPEFGRFRSLEEAQAAHKSFPGIMAILAAYGVGFVVVTIATRLWFGPDTLSYYFVAFLYMTMFGVYWTCAVRPRIRRHLREKLVELGIPVCVKCAYNLTANESGVCPECGTEIEAT